MAPLAGKGLFTIKLRARLIQICICHDSWFSRILYDKDSVHFPIFQNRQFLTRMNLFVVLLMLQLSDLLFFDSYSSILSLDLGGMRNGILYTMDPHAQPIRFQCLPLLKWNAWDPRTSEQFRIYQIKCRLMQTNLIQGLTASKERMQRTSALHPLNANLGDLWWNKIFVCNQQHLLDQMLFVSISWNENNMPYFHLRIDVLCKLELYIILKNSLRNTFWNVFLTCNRNNVNWIHCCIQWHGVGHFSGCRKVTVFWWPKQRDKVWPKQRVPPSVTETTQAKHALFRSRCGHDLTRLCTL